jgi:hypothetical protein
MKIMQKILIAVALLGSLALATPAQAGEYWGCHRYHYYGCYHHYGYWHHYGCYHHYGCWHRHYHCW